MWNVLDEMTRRCRKGARRKLRERTGGVGQGGCESWIRPKNRSLSARESLIRAKLAVDVVRSEPGWELFRPGWLRSVIPC